MSVGGDTLNGAGSAGGIPALKKNKMGMWTVAFMIFCLCAGGCFGIEEMISSCGPGMTIALLLIIPIVYGYPVGLVCAELGSAMPDEGGFYVWPKKAFGEFWGFQAGWWRTVATYIDNTLYVILGGAYVSVAFDLDPTADYLAKVGMITLFIIINLKGLREVGFLSSVLAVLVLLAFTLVAVVGVLHWQFNPVTPFLPPGSGFAETLGTGLAIAMWCYCGYESMSSLAGEMENPQVIPKALIIAIPAIAFIYVIPTLAGVASLGHWDEWSPDGGYTYSMVLTQYVSPVFGVIFAFVAVAANLGIYNSYVASGSRGFFVLAEDNLAPKVLTKLGKKSGVPWVAIILMGITNAILCRFAFEMVVVIDVFVYMFSQALMMFAAMKLRKTMPERQKGTFRIPLGDKGLAVLCIVPVIVMVVALYINGTDYFIGGIVGVLSGPIAYVIFKWAYKGLWKKEPKAYPLNRKTRLGVHDLRHISDMLFIIAAVAAIGAIFLPWYEDSWGQWANGYLAGDPSEWAGLDASEYTETADGVWIKGYYESMYGVRDIFGTFVTAIRVSVPVCAVLALLLRIADRRVQRHGVLDSAEQA
ncbi:MAG: APC family permease [Clostridiales Family XIII bacterium]|jgi:amino acid transporter|nr:APC family permease [Clostridiales Family XIII bacterium]